MRQNNQPSDQITLLPVDDNSGTRSDSDELTRTDKRASGLDLPSESSRQAIVNAAWNDMRQRRKNGEHFRAEDYVGQEDGNIDEDLAVDMIYAEYALRRESGEAPCAADFVERFPRFATAIVRQLEVHEGMESADVGPTWNLTRASDVVLTENQKQETQPTHVGKYVLLSKLGKGGQANVYRAVHPTLGRELVVKLGHKPLVQNSPTATRLFEEGRILADLDHPNLARIYDMGLDAGYPYLAMEYVRGRTLDQYAKEEKLSWCERARVVAKVAAALSAAHHKNVVHLDIKPNNIVVDEQGNPRLLDFGLARLFDAFHNVSDQTNISGTLQYMAPEQARGDGALIGRRTDIFGLGGVLYFLLTNKVPFPGSNKSELMPRITKGEWEQQPLKAASIPQGLQTICKRALAPRIDDRYASADDFATALHKYVRYARLRPLITKAAVLLIAVSTLFFLNRHYRPAAAETSPVLAARVRQPGGNFAELAHVLPLHNGDQLQFHGEIPATMHASLFVFTSSGELQQLASWEPVIKARRLQYPQPSSASVSLDEHSGTEFIFLCTRRSAPITLAEVSKVWSGTKSLELLPDYTVAMIDSMNIRFENFGKGLGPIFQHDDPETVFRQRLEPVLKQLESQFSGIAGIAFTHKR